MSISIAKYYQKAFKKYQNIDITIHLNSIPSKELEPEIELAWKNRSEYKKVKLFLIVFDYSAHELRIRQIKDFSVTTNIRVS